MLSELVETVPPEPEIPEPEPEPDKAVNEAFEKQFINTDSNESVANAPENARFESDRNTVASTQFQPDRNMPQVDGPTLRGEDNIRGLNLNNQEYQDGEVQDNSTPPPSQPPVAQPVPIEEQPPAEQPNETENEESEPGESDQPPLEKETELAAQPESEITSETPTLASTDEKFMEVNAGQQAADLAEIKEEETTNRDKTDQPDEPASAKPKPQIKASPVVSDQELFRRQKELEQRQAELTRQYTESMFNPAYRAQTRQSSQNGNTTNIGSGSVDAESTAVGAYKKAVANAIGKEWHHQRRLSGVVRPGFMRVQFVVTAWGKVQDVKVLDKEADTLLTEFSLKAINKAKIPAMPAKVSQELGARGLKMDYNIVIY